MDGTSQEDTPAVWLDFKSVRSWRQAVVSWLEFKSASIPKCKHLWQYVVLYQILKVSNY